MFEHIPLSAAIVFSMLATAALLALSRPALTAEPPAVDVVAASGVDSVDATSPQRSQSDARGGGVRAEAKASAKATASSSATGSNRQDCRAESSARSEARAGDEYAHDEDSDSDQVKNGDCRAEASSSARATVGKDEQKQ